MALKASVAAARRLGLAGLTVLAALLALGGTARASDSADFLSVLAGGQGETVSADEFAAMTATGEPPSSFVDQNPFYSGLIPAAPRLRRADQVEGLFKPAGLHPPADGETTSSTPRAGVEIARDRFNVPFVEAGSRADAMWGIGYAQAEDRLFFMDVLRHLGRGRLSELVGTGPEDIFLGLDANVLTQVDWSDAELEAQLDALRAHPGGEGQQVIDDLTAYTAGINAYIQRAQIDPSAMPVEYPGVGRTPRGWTPVDTAAVLNLVTWIQSFIEGFEPLTGQALVEARRRFGRRTARQVVGDFRNATDAEGDTTIARRYPYPAPDRIRGRGIALPDLGSIEEREVVVEGGSSSQGRAQLGPPAGLPLPHGMSNALLVSADRSTTGRPLAVMGPQLGYWAPQIFWEFAVNAPGLERRGATIPGLPYLFVGRGPDWAWSVTSTLSDTIDTFAERLCEPDGSPPTLASDHYSYRGRCIPFTRRDVVIQTRGTAVEPDEPPRRVVLRAERSVHGTVQAHATVRGRPVALVKADPSRGREVEALLVFRRLTDRDIDGPADFRRAVAGFSHKLNWYYAGPRSIAYVQAEPHPLRAGGVDLDLPMWGTGHWDWRGFDPASGSYRQLAARRLPRATDPQSGAFVNWNNRAAPGWRQGELLQTGAVFRSDLLSDPLRRLLRRRGRVGIAEVVRVMGLAATTDLRGRKVLPLVLRVLGHPRGRDAREAAALLRAWVRGGAHRRDRDLDGKLEHGAAILLVDAWWEPLVRSMFQPVLGTRLTARLEAMQPFTSRNAVGDFGPGWWSYVSKDLRALLGRRVRDPLSRRYCGRGSLARCRAALRSSLRETMSALRGEHGPDPGEWRIPATCDAAAGEQCDQISFFGAGAVTPPPIPWQNRPTFQQVVALGAFGGAPPAGAGVHSFAGSCAIEATTRFDPPVTSGTAGHDWRQDGTGICDGTLDGQEVSDAPITIEVAGRIEGSCSSARILPSPGRVIFTNGTPRTADDVPIAFVLEGQGTFTETDFTMRGTTSGSATGHATFLTPRTPPDIATKCFAEGVSEVPTDASVTTDSPLVSEDAQQRQQLRLRVRPRVARAGRRTRFRFRVSAPDARPVRGALIRFAGRRARTGKAGGARIVARIRRPGRYRARATRSGFRATTAVVRVRRR